MKLAVMFLAVAAVAVADKLVDPPVAILRSEQVNPDELGAYSSHFEADNGINFQISGSQGADGGSNMIGSWSYPQEDGSVASFQFVANENGYQPQSDLLPVIPPFPQFVLDQIIFAREERERKAREGN